MNVNLTKSQVSNLASFIQFNLIDELRNNDEIDNINYVIDMCEAYKTLREAEKGGADDGK